MKILRILKYPALFCCCLIAISFFTINCFAEEEANTLPKEYDDFMDSLPDEVADALPDGVFSSETDRVHHAARAVSDPGYLLQVLLSFFEDSFLSLLPTMALLCGTVILSAVLYLINGFFSSGTGRAVSLCVRLCTYCVIVEASVVSIERVAVYFERLFASVAAFLPLSGVLYAMGGNVTGAAANSVSLSGILTLCELLCTKTVLPFFSICLSLSMLSVFEGSEALAGQSLSTRLRKWYTTALGIIMMILTTALASQNILSAKADSVAMKGAKFAVSGFVPISGGTVSSTLGTMAASVEMIRGSVGVIGIFAILMMLLPVILELAALRGILSFASFLAGMLGCTGEARLLGETEGLYGFLEGVAALAATIFLVAMGILAVTASVVT